MSSQRRLIVILGGSLACIASALAAASHHSDSAPQGDELTKPAAIKAAPAVDHRPNGDR
jgi:hypothetical protein